MPGFHFNMFGKNRSRIGFFRVKTALGQRNRITELGNDLMLGGIFFPPGILDIIIPAEVRFSVCIANIAMMDLGCATITLRTIV